MSTFPHQRYIWSSLLFLFATMIISCEDEESESPVSNSPLPETSVLVICEGGFGQSNSSISIYDPLNEMVQDLVFQQINGYSLGDILHSAEMIGDDIYAVINNSGRVDVFDKDSLVSTGPILGLGSPGTWFQRVTPASM